MKPRSSGTPLEFPKLSVDRQKGPTPVVYESGGQLHTWSYGGHTPAGLFKALDGAMIRADDASFRVTVYSVHDVANHLWVQLTLNGRHDQPLVLDMAPTAGVEAALEAIESHLSNPRPSGNVVRVG
jgi:hypothetical protein